MGRMRVAGAVVRGWRSKPMRMAWRLESRMGMFWSRTLPEVSTAWRAPDGVRTRMPGVRGLRARVVVPEVMLGFAVVDEDGDLAVVLGGDFEGVDGGFGWGDGFGLQVEGIEEGGVEGVGVGVVAGVAVELDGVGGEDDLSAAEGVGGDDGGLVDGCEEGLGSG
jgi:hypothetical protein